MKDEIRDNKMIHEEEEGILLTDELFFSGLEDLDPCEVTVKEFESWVIEECGEKILFFWRHLLTAEEQKASAAYAVKGRVFYKVKKDCERKFFASLSREKAEGTLTALTMSGMDGDICLTLPTGKYSAGQFASTWNEYHMEEIRAGKFPILSSGLGFEGW